MFHDSIPAFGPVRHFMVPVLAFCVGIGCSSETDSPDSYLTVTTVRRPYTMALTVEGELEAKVAQTLLTPRVNSQPKVAYLAEEGTRVKKDDVVVVFEAKEVETEYLNALDEAEIARAEAKQKEADLALQRLMLESELRRLEAAAATARLQLPKLEFAAPRMRAVQELEMQKSEMEATKIRRKLVSLEGIEKEELEHLRLKITQGVNKVSSSKMFLDRLVLRAPVDGIVVRTENWSTGNKIQEGDAVWGGMPVAKIPDLTVMQVKLLVGETEAQRLKSGQSAKITIPSADNLQVPGTVTSVAKVAKTIDRNSKVKKVDVIVQVDSTHAALLPGLTAECRITVEDLSGALIVPLECVFDQDSLKVVYSLERGRFTPHEVKIAQQGSDFAVITEGIDEGVMLALRKPSPALMR